MTTSQVVDPITLPTMKINRQRIMTIVLPIPLRRIVMPVVCLHLQKMMNQFYHVVLAECIEYLLTQRISMKSHGTPLIFLGTLSRITLGTGLEVEH